MQQRLAVVASRVATAAQRRAGLLEPAKVKQLDAVVSVVGADYPGVGAAEDDDAIALLAEDFRLDPVEVDLLVTAAAPELDPNLGLAFDLLAGRTGVAHPTVMLALELCGLPTATAAGAARLQESGRLLTNGLVEVVGEGSWLSRSVRVPDRVRRHLVDVDDPPPEVAAVAVAATPVSSAASLEVARALEAGAPLVYVYAPGGTAGVATAAAGLADAGRGALAVDVRLVPAGDLEPVLRAAAREAGLRGQGLLVAGAEVMLAAERRALLWTALERTAPPVVAVGARVWDPWTLRTVPLSVQAPLLVAAQRGQVWKDALGFTVPHEQGHPPLTGLRLTPEEIVATASYAQTLARSRGTEVDASLVREAARVLGSGGGTGAAAGRVVSGPGGSPAGWDDLVLPASVMAEVRRLVRWASYRDEVLARGDVHGKGGKGTGITAMFTGGPGTGKTLAAHVVADELNIDLLQVDLSSVVDKYVGETEKNLEKIFREAESRNVVLFFDEADALFGSRASVQDARDRYANQEVSYLLQRMEHFDGITVLATNLRGNLDPAFTRRMQFIVHFRDPDEPTRRRLWQHHLDRAGDTDDSDPVDIAHLAATMDLAGGDIRNVVLAAAYDAACDGQPIGMRHLQEAAGREYHKLGRRVPTE